jgi:hypothetical protein
MTHVNLFFFKQIYKILQSVGTGKTEKIFLETRGNINLKEKYFYISMTLSTDYLLF